MTHEDQLVDFIKGYLASLLGLSEDKLEVDVPFERYGLDSTAAAGLTGELSEKFDVDLSMDAAYDFPTITSLTQHMLSLLPQGATS